MRRLELLAFAIVCGLSVPRGASGQRLAGSVREAGTAAPIAGAVVSLLDSAGHATARTITDANGRYTVARAPDARTLRVVRIGFRPVTVPLSTSDVPIDVAMVRIPFQLETMRVSTDATCGAAADSRAALELWDQARAALLTAIVAREANPAKVSILSYTRRFDVRDRRVTQHRFTVMNGVSHRPVVAARPAEYLAAEGYMQRIGQEWVYYAPDADVLFDDSFAGEHCFGVQVGTGDHRGQIGLKFQPRSGPGRDKLVDVRGTLWLDSIASALVQLEFRYTGVDQVTERVGSGGTMHFQSMSNGVVFIDDWTILLPSLSRLPTKSGAPALIPILGLNESGGVVLSAEWGDGVKWTGAIGAIRGQVTERGTSSPVPGVVVSLTGVGSTATDDAGQFSFGLLPPGLYGLEVIDSTFAGFLRLRTDGRDAVVGRGDTVRANFEVASHASFVAALCKDDPFGAVLLGVVDDGIGEWPKQLRVEAEWLTAYSANPSGVTATTAHSAGSVDAGGRFSVCGIPREGPAIRLRVLLGKLPLADTVLRAGDARPGPVRLVAWNVQPGLFANAQRGYVSSLSGRVVRTDGGTPIVDAEVWLIPSDVRTRTDSAGQFRFMSLQTGPQLMQVRRLGYAPLRDTVTLRAHEETVRQISLTSQATELDTMRTVSGTVKYSSPSLRRFEERRASGFGGYFISEAELRKDDHAPVSSILRVRIPGVTFAQYKSRTYIGSTRGGSETFRADPNDGASPKGCWVSVYIDGLPFYSGPPDAAPDMSRMQVTDYGGIEYYAGSATRPPEFSSRTGCGVLLLWTRER